MPTATDLQKEELRKHKVSYAEPDDLLAQVKPYLELRKHYAQEWDSNNYPQQQQCYKNMMADCEDRIKEILFLP